MWELKGKDKNDAAALREILVNRYNNQGLAWDRSDPDIIAAYEILDKFLAFHGLTRSQCIMDLWTQTLFTKEEQAQGMLKQRRIDLGLIGG